MADSLNTGIQKLGDTLSAKLFGNSKDNPEGASNFSGVYIGPGGGVTRQDSFTVDVDRYGPSFLPIGYFNKTNQWIDDKLSSIYKESGISRSNFPKEITGKDGKIVYTDGSGNKISISGFTPPGYFVPKTNLWIDSRFSKIVNSVTGTSRTFLDGPSINVSPAQQLMNPDTGNLDFAGFTPVSYYRSDKAVYLVRDTRKLNSTGLITIEESLDYSKKLGPDGFYDSKFSPDYSFKFGLEDDKNGSRSPLNGDKILTETPYENEDPLFTGFEVIINASKSPLLNGELLNFIRNFSSYSEISSREEIYRDFIFEFFKFFKFDNETSSNFDFKNPGISPRPDGSDIPSIFNTQLRSKRHYVKKIKGLDKLIEANTPSQQSSFVKYKNDLVTLSFYEDTTLELGTLSSLYKLLYWSRLKGKNIIPENLLRFDCTLIVSEVRNFTRVKKAAADGQLETLKENVSRYVYDLYECQLFFDKMSHGDAIAMDAIASPDSLEVNLSYKYSTSRFERYDFNSDVYKYVDNSQDKPQEISSKNANNVAIDENGSLSTFRQDFLQPLNNGYAGKDVVSSIVSDRLSALQRNEIKTGVNRDANVTNAENGEDGTKNIDNLRESDKINTYKIESKKATLLKEPTKSLQIYPSRPTIGSEGEIPLSQNGNILQKAGQTLLQNVKKAALNESQRQLNSQFRLVNNSLDKIRNSFGIGRMSDPTNVYDIPANGSTFFFDVKNSLRNFGGDVLGGLLGG